MYSPANAAMLTQFKPRQLWQYVCQFDGYKVSYLLYLSIYNDPTELTFLGYAL